ncbi:drug/metabolite transporter (DMT)-like permease [Streptomyces umbrinus]|uniref:Drug/metabolite transporter (DMT)-like permease n=1 Tax=Streptomyces umbrinus TaxID=67370 RepID=A0ABU0TA59_9ACTN|nr:EamA family transporter [Streptomyces umbrinus]MDQ1032701.1 drug/metabolite transporter (DMT)-like permease [Streptomyces umbrinus]
MGVLAALGSAICYGVADFTGGLLSRRAYFVVVALAGQAGGLVLALVTAPLLSKGVPDVAELAWGAASGVGTGIGMIFLYRGMSRGSMSLVVPVSAVTGVALPVLVGVLLLGDRPQALSWFGLTVAVPALWLVSRTGDGNREGLGSAASSDGLIAGCGIALQYLALVQAGGGIWPVAAGRLAAVITLLPLAAPTRKRPRITTRNLVGAVATGMTAALALILYSQAVRQQLTVIAVALSSFYPAIPVLLGITLLRERLGRIQVTGLVAAGVAIALLALG